MQNKVYKYSNVFIFMQVATNDVVRLKMYAAIKIRIYNSIHFILEMVNYFFGNWT